MGKAIARRYAREGARVSSPISISTRRGRVAEQISAAGGEAIAVQTDVRDQAQAQAMVDAAVETFGGLDILVNNAGVGKIIPFLETTNEDWDFMFDVNCKGLLWCSQAAAQADDRAGARRQDHQSRLPGRATRRGAGAGLLRQQGLRDQHDAVDGAGAGASTRSTSTASRRASSIPRSGSRSTSSSRSCSAWEIGEPKRNFVESIPLGRIEQPEDVTGAAIFLASAESDYMTQQTLNVDGGNWPS